MRRTENVLDTPPVADAADGEQLPLSFAQQRMWLLHHYAPDVPLYNSPIAFRLRGPLSAPVLERALRLLAERHEGMRTTFPSVDGLPEVEISDEVSFHLPVEELQGLPAAAREEAALERATAEARRVFDMAQGPLWRALLLRLAPEDHLFVLTMHHIITDGWSMGLLCEELSRTYEALWKGEAPALAELPLQYADFAAWQREWLSGDVLASQVAYWKENLAGAPPVLELPTDRPRPAKNSYRAARHAFMLPASLTKPLEALSAKEGATPFMALLSAFSALLGRYSLKDDIVVGTPIANRNRAEIERLVGFFVNTLVLRVRLEGNPSFRELLQRVRQVTLGAYDHQDLPFEKLVEELSPERNQSHSPLFQVLFDFATADISLRLPGLEATSLRLDEGSTPFDVSVSLEKRGEAYGGWFIYNADLFESATLERLERHYARLLGAAVEQPERALSELPLLEEDEEHRLLVEWNRTDAEPRADSTLHQLLEHQVRATPEALALVVGTRRFTYRQLDERANQLAWHLRSLGVGPEVPVAVCLERTEALLVALLAVLKAGGAYVPLDPVYPSQRLAFSLADARSPLVLTQRSLLEKLRGLGTQAALLPLDEPEAFSHHPTHRPDCPAQPRNLAYVLYTSGSTGRPKGVAVQHSSAAALVQWALEAFSPARLTGVLAATSVCFDLSIFELFAPLSCGGSVYLADNALALPSLPAASEVNLINTVPSAVAELVRQGALPASVRTVNLAGEPLPASLVRALYGLGTVESVYNLYGPTEDTTYSTWALVPRESSAPPLIGRPLPGTQAYVLDARLRSVPQGVPGELYLGGLGLARGYLGRPELTAERFVPNPFSATPGARMYRTGDRVRWRADGQLEYLERIDFQVKVRGFRIELGEVEQALLRHPAVREAVAVAREGGPDGKQLVAYVTGSADSLSTAELRSFLREHLPEYMVPSAFVVLEALPLTANGKLDRQALPAPAPLAGPSHGFIPPRDRIELQLCGIWEEVLNVRPIGIRDDFFELGGTSLVAVRLMHRIRETFERSLPISALFSAKSVEELALLLREEQGPKAWTPLVPIQPGGKRRPFYCVHPLGGTVLGFGALARRLGPQQPFFGLEHVRPGKPTNRVEAMATEYLAAIRKHQPEGPYLLGGKSVGGLVAIEMARMLQAEGQRVELLALLGTAVPKELPGVELDKLPTQMHATKEDALIARILQQFGQEFPELHELARLSKEEKLRQGLRIAKEHGAVPADFGESQLDHLFWAWHAEAEAFSSYRASFYDGHITHFVPACDEGKPLMDWSALCRSWEVHVVAGEHETLDEEPHVEVLARALGTCLERVGGSRS